MAGTRPTRKQVLRIRTNLSMVFQQFNLWAHMTILQNVMEAPVTVLGATGRGRERRARLSRQGGHRRQMRCLPRAAFRRPAAARRHRAGAGMEPEALLFDEPTSALDPELEQEVVGDQGPGREGRTMIIVTHDMKLAATCRDHVVFLHQGLIEEEGPPETPVRRPEIRPAAAVPERNPPA
jgi:polar amino acid transport system ATP-binding protein